MSNQEESVNYDSTVSAINEFIIATTEYLNSFMSTCESKLTTINNKINTLEKSLALLDAKTQNAQQDPCCNRGMEFLRKLQGHDADATSSENVTENQNVEDQKTQVDVSNIEETQSGLLWKDHPVYAPFFRQMKMGVPVEAIKAKMSMNNYDPHVLDFDPNSVVPTHYL